MLEIINMQSFTTCGLKIEYDNINHNEYLKLKSDIETFCNNCLRLAKLYKKRPFMRYILMKPNTYLTCSFINNHIELGVYNSLNKTLTQMISCKDSLYITPLLLDKFFIRVYNYAISKDNPIIEPLQSIWDEYLLQKRK